MKRLITVVSLCMALFIGMASADAKTTKKRSGSTTKSTSAASISRTYADGFADVTGHTYSGNCMGLKMTVRFRSDGYASVTMAANGKSTSFTAYWSYQGMGIVSIFEDGGDANDFYIGDKGKCIYVISSGGEVLRDCELKLVK